MQSSDSVFRKHFGRKVFTYLLELPVVIIGVYLGFMANNYSEKQKQKQYVKTVIQEMYKSLGEDIKDANENLRGHKRGMECADYFFKLALNQKVNKDSFSFYFFNLTRSFVSIQNTAPFEALRDHGLNLIANDSVRAKIIKLYDFQYEVLEKIEEKYQESQMYANESHHLLDIIDKVLIYGNEGKLKQIKHPVPITEEEKTRFILILKRIKNTRYFNQTIYKGVVSDMEELRSLLTKEYPFILETSKTKH